MVTDTCHVRYRVLAAILYYSVVCQLLDAGDHFITEDIPLNNNRLKRYRFHCCHLYTCQNFFNSFIKFRLRLYSVRRESRYFLNAACSPSRCISFWTLRSKPAASA